MELKDSVCEHMMVTIERETPSPGGWEKSTFQTIGEFESHEAEKYLSDNGYTKAGDKFDAFWYAPVEWPSDRYRIKPRKE